MLKFNKLFTYKIISIIVIIAFTVTSTCYGIDLPKKSNLRAPLLSSTYEGRRRFNDAAALLCNVTQDLSNSQISEMMAQKGYPQLKEIWEKFEKLGIEEHEASKENTGKERKRYLYLLSINSILNQIVLILAPFNIFFIGIYIYLFTQHARSPATYLLFFIGSFGFLSVSNMIFGSIIKQYASNKKLKELAFLLSKQNYRNWFDNQAESQETMQELKNAGVNELWDNPDYCKTYKINGHAVEEVGEVEDHISITQKALRYFIGYRDENGYTHAGELTGSLKRGAKSSREILKNYSDIIELARNGTLTRDNSLYFLSELKANYIKPGSKGEEIIDDFIEAVSKGHYLVRGVVEVNVWQRDPWVDLSSHTEFNCCAFLGGINDLGVFGYISNKSISMLDFKTKDGRICRVIMGAGIFTDKDGKDRGILVVDSVEGTLSLDRALIKKEIEDYATTCGFSKVFYNDGIFTAVPKKFIQHVEETGAPLEYLDIALADSSTREYMETFGRPLFIKKFLRFLHGILNFLFTQNFVNPKGKVRGYTVDLQTQVKSFMFLESDVVLTERQLDLEKVSMEVVSPGNWHDIREDIMRIEEGFHENIRSPEEDLRTIFENPTSITVILRYDNKIVGYVAGGRLEDYDYIEGIKNDKNYGRRNTAYIDSIALLDEFQGHGLGRDLRREFLKLAAMEGYKYVTAYQEKGVASKRGDEVLAEFGNWYNIGKTFEYSRTTLVNPPIRAGPLYQSSGITIEKTLPLDWDSIKNEIMDVEEECFPREWRQTEEDLGSSFTDPASLALIIRSQGKIIGYLVGGPLENYEGIIKRRLLGFGKPMDTNFGLHNSFYVESIAILPKYSQNLIGIRIFKILNNILKRKGYKYMTIHTIFDTLIRLFLRVGAEKVFEDYLLGAYLRLSTVRDSTSKAGIDNGHVPGYRKGTKIKNTLRNSREVVMSI